MLEQPPKSDDKKADRDSPTSAALKCAYHLMQQRIISNPNDMMGILLFGTEKTDLGDGDNTFQNCYLLSDLNVPCAQDVKRLRDLVENEDEAAELLRPADEPPSIATVLFCANQIFTTKAPNFSSRRLFLVTDNDNPAKTKQDKDTAVTRARDLYDLGCTIDLFPISRPGHGFDRTKFYDVRCISQQSSSDSLTISGFGIPLLALRPRCTSHAFFNNKISEEWRWHIPSKTAPLLHQLKSYTQEGFIQPSIGDRTWPANRCKRLYLSQAPGTRQAMLRLGRW